MGANNSHDFDQNKFNNLWQRKQANINGRTIWKNRSNPLRQIQQYPIYANTQHDIKRQGQLFELRRGSDQLVAATHLKQTVKNGLCSSAAQGRLFLQRIPLKLDALQHIPFPDILHMHFNCLTGYKKLAKVVGPFRPQQQQIGFNLQGQAKVWLNGDFSSSNPTSKQTSQQSMVRNILQIIQDNTDNNTTPRQDPSIINFIYRNKNQATFDEALIAVRQYANQYNNGVIPKKLDCLQKTGIENISKSLTQLPASNIIESQRNSFNNNVVVEPQVSRCQPPNRVLTTQHRTSYTPNPPQVNNYSAFTTNQPTRFVQPVQGPLITSNANFNMGSSRVLKVTQPPPMYNAQFIVNPQPQPCFVQRPSVFVQPAVQPLVPPVVQSYHAQTVRPVQQLIDVRPPQEQRVIQQIIRQPVNQQPIEQHFVNQGVVVQRDNQPVPLNIRPNIPVNVVPNQVVQNTVFNNQIQQTRVDNLSNQNKISQQVVQIKTLSNELNQNQFSRQAQSKNVIQSNTSAVQIGGTSALVQKLWSGNNTFETKNYSSFENNNTNTGLQFNSSSGRFKDVQLQDGKSSQALLAQLRGLSSTKYDNPSSYKFQSSSKNYNYQSYKPQTALNTQYTQKYTTSKGGEYDSDSYNIFNKYAKGNNNNLQDNLEMKYSMTQELYDNNPQNNYQYESNQYQQHDNNQYQQGHNQYQYQHQQHNQYQHQNHYQQTPEEYQYQQEGQYHVDYDPQILADIQRMNK